MDPNSDIESENEFQFETDHVALRGNEDYNKLLKYIITLEVQKIKAIKDIEQINECEKHAFNNPLEFADNIKNGQVDLPPREIISDVPHINWKQYGLEDTISESEHDKYLEIENANSTKVRGRTFNQSKPETFNQLWSCEEQRRLEELLEVYPEEEVEARRYRKIAEALGTRTPTQVMSRVQKYFAKLAKAGLRIPGRAPKGAIGFRQPFSSKNKSNRFLYKKSTFFPQLSVPVKMDDEANSGSNGSSEFYENTFEPAYSGVLQLLKAAREQRLLDEKSPIWQDVLCMGCQKERFLGARWMDSIGTVYCTDCVIQLQPNQALTPIRFTS